MKTIRDQIKSGEIGKLYLLCGEETYLVHLNLSRLKQALLTPEDGDMNCDIFLESLDLDQFKISVETLPFLSDRRVVLCENTGAFGKKAKEYEDLSLVFSSIPDTTTVIFTESDVDARARNTKAIKKYGQVFNYARLSEHDLTIWVRQMMKKKGLSCEDAVIAYFLSLTGTDMARIESETGKVCAYAAGKGSVTRQAVDEVVSPSIEVRIFRLTDCLAVSNRAGAYAALHDLLSQGENAQRILYMIEWQFRNLYQVCLLLSYDHQEALRRAVNEVRIPSFKAEDYFRQARSFGQQRLLQILKSLEETDFAVKNGKMSIEEALDLTVMSYTQRKATA